MIFLIEYNRKLGRLVRFESYGDDREGAEFARLSLELDLNKQGTAHEVVLLEAENEDALRQTHQRYFSTLEEFIKASA